VTRNQSHETQGKKKMNATKMTPLAVIVGGVAITAAALGATILQGSPNSDAIAGGGMSTGVTVTAAVPPSAAPILAAEPSIKGPAPLPPEEQGLPG
jgi:hypothetical protein